MWQVCHIHKITLPIHDFDDYETQVNIIVFARSQKNNKNTLRIGDLNLTGNGIIRLQKLCRFRNCVMLYGTLCCTWNRTIFSPYNNTNNGRIHKRHGCGIRHFRNVTHTNNINYLQSACNASSFIHILTIFVIVFMHTEANTHSCNNSKWIPLLI